MIIDNEYSYDVSFLTCKPSNPEEDEYTENKNAEPDCFFDAHGLVLYNHLSYLGGVNSKNLLKMMEVKKYLGNINASIHRKVERSHGL